MRPPGYLLELEIDERFADQSENDQEGR